MASRPPRQPPHTRRLQRIRIHPLAGQPLSRAGQLTHRQPHRHYLCLQAVRSHPQPTGAAILREQLPVLTRSRTMNLPTPHFRLHRPDIPRKTGLVDTTRPQACTQILFHRHQKYLLIRRPNEQTRSRRGLSPTLPPSPTAMSTSHHTMAHHTARTSFLMTL